MTVTTAGRSSGRSQEPPPDWERAGAAAGLVAAVLLVVNLVVLSSAPSIASPAAEIVRHLRSNYVSMIAASLLGSLTVVGMLPFLASLRAFVRRSGRDSEWQWTVTILGGAVAMAVELVGSALLAAAADVAHHSGDPSAVAALFAGAKICATFGLTPFATMLLANGRTMTTVGTRLRWLVRLSVEIALVAIVSAAAVFFDSTWLGPAEPAVAVVGLLVAMWLAAVALTMLDGGAAGTV